MEPVSIIHTHFLLLQSADNRSPAEPFVLLSQFRLSRDFIHFSMADEHANPAPIAPLTDAETRAKIDELKAQQVSRELDLELQQLEAAQAAAAAPSQPAQQVRIHDPEVCILFGGRESVARCTLLRYVTRRLAPEAVSSVPSQFDPAGISPQWRL